MDLPYAIGGGMWQNAIPVALIIIVDDVPNVHHLVDSAL